MVGVGVEIDVVVEVVVEVGVKVDMNACVLSIVVRISTVNSWMRAIQASGLAIHSVICTSPGAGTP